MAKRIIALVMLLCMALPMFVACGEEKKESVSTTSPLFSQNTKEEDPEIAKVEAYIAELATEQKASVEGKTFTWIGVGVTDAEEETGDLEEDALYYRQRDLEDIFGIDWVTAENEGVEGGPHPTFENVRKDVMAGTKAYNVVGGTTAAVCQPLFLQGCLADVSGYEVLDLSQEWWTQSLSDTYQIAGATYFLTGMISRTYFLDSYCVMFDKQVATDYSIDINGMYELVKNGEWTFDQFFKIAESVPSNENGTGAYRFNRPNGTVLMWANNIPITYFDELGNPYVPEELSKELSDLADKFSAIFGNDAYTAGVTEKEDINNKYGFKSFSEMFTEEQILFFIETTGEAAYLREADVNFGILPLPKKDTAQEKYISYIEPWGAYHVAVPKTTNNEHVTDVMLEAMGALSLKYLKPAIYDNILKSRSTYDKDSKLMIDLILDGKTYDLVNMLQPDESYVRMLNNAISYSSQSFSSSYRMQGRTMNKKITERIKQIENGTY
ncbi:MAG: hypothetical protein IKM46_05790 [Clostridia bacterium]|nr:hypothetical protein [Clostridia bacterium]